MPQVRCTNCGCFASLVTGCTRDACNATDDALHDENYLQEEVYTE